jgi:hypothetical protein
MKGGEERKGRALSRWAGPADLEEDGEGRVGRLGGRRAADLA